MENRYQIIRYRNGRWEFSAHGAIYSQSEATKSIELITKNSGDRVMLLPVENAGIERSDA